MIHFLSGLRQDSAADSLVNSIRQLGMGIVNGVQFFPDFFEYL